MKLNISNNHSKTQYVHSGLLQGSVFGPLFFIIFINDLPNFIKSEIELYPDDFKLFVRPLVKENNTDGFK